MNEICTNNGYTPFENKVQEAIKDLVPEQTAKIISTRVGSLYRKAMPQQQPEVNGAVDLEIRFDSLDAVREIADREQTALAEAGEKYKQLKATRPQQTAQEWVPISEWHEDDGYAFWAKFPICEPYYSGSPLCDDWPGYHTHFIPMSIFDKLIDRDGNLLPAAPKAGLKEE